MEKRCTQCLTIKPLSEFHKHVRMHDGLQPKCKPCMIQNRHEYAAANRDKIKVQSASWYARNRDRDNARRRDHYRRTKKAGPRFTGDPLEDPRTTKNPN